jgi:hypothetical protein
VKNIIIAAALLLSASGCSQLSDLKINPKDELLYLINTLDAKDAAANAPNK